MTNETVASGRLLRPVDAASLAVFRIVFGVAVAIDAWRYLAYGWVREYYIAPAIHFPHVDVAWLRPWPGEGMIFHYVAVSALALSVAAGLWYRTTALLLALAYGWAFLLEKSVYMNHHYLMVLLAFLLAVLPAQRALSVDVWRGVIARAQVPFLAVALLRFQLAIVYLYGAVAKLNPDWLAGEPMLSSLRDGGPEIPSLAHLLPAELLATFIAWAGIAVDVAIPVLLLRRSTVGWGIALAVAFHALNGVFLRIGVFSWLMIGAVTIFLPPD